MHFATFIGAVALAGSANAHIALWDKGMFGLNYPYQSTDTANTQWNAVDPVDPLRESDALSEDQWFAHGYKDYPPAPGDFMTLPSGGVYYGEVGCNREVTSLRNPDITDPLGTYACPGDSGVGALHVMNRYNETVDNKWFGGSALAIAYTSNVTALRPNDMTVISVVQDSVWFRQINYTIPSGLPPCPTGGCLCSWNWIHEANHGEGYPYEIYNVLFRCTVTGSTNSRNTVKRGAVPKDCTGNPSACVSGPKTPMYIYQADGNNLPHLDTPPSYNANWGFADGAQNDIFTAAATPAPTTYLANGYATPTGTATGTANQPTATAIPSDWSALGCMVDDTNNRTLPNGAYYNRQNSTISQCVAFCNSEGYIYAGTEYGVECWCSNTARLQLANSTDCNVPCPGDSFAKCGGSYRINVFMSSYTPSEAGTTTTSAATSYPTASLPSGWSSMGCSYDDSNVRALNRGSTTSANNTVPSCIANCAAQGYSYAGVEYGQECWCGTTANFTAAGSGCNVPCAGDSSQICGGSYRIDIFSHSTSTASSTSSTKAAVTASSTITVKSSTTSSSSKATATISSTSLTTTTTVKSSTSSSSSEATTSTSSTSLKTTTTSSSSSTSTKPSSTSTKVAGTVPVLSSSTTTSSASKVTTTTISSVKSTTTSSSTSKVTSSTTTTSSAATATVSLPATWKDLGCNVDGGMRLLNGTMVTSTNNTAAWCINYCSTKGYTYAGTEYGTQCFCGNTFKANLATSGCTSKCAGDATQICGGSYRINVFGNTSTSTSTAAASTTKARRRELGRL